jgi:hypothetical protein
MRLRKGLWTTMLATVIAAAALALPAGAIGATVYDNIPSPQPGNVPSVPYEASGAAEWGGQIQLAGTERQNPTVTVLMSSWGCQSGHWTSNDCVTTAGATFSHLITLNIYTVGVGGVVGPLIATASQTFNIPYRPSHDPVNCPATPEKWFSAADGLCYNGFATPISFTLNSVTLPNKAIVSVAYNTTHYGYSPIGATACSATAAGCGYDSLNVGTAPLPTIGIAPQPSDAYLYDVFGSEYCDGGVGGTNVFRLDAGCWTGFQPAFEIAAVTINPPPNKDACKGNGWQNYTRADGSKFKNQGDCIQYVNTGK